jgi:hypothetical protein
LILINTGRPVSNANNVTIFAGSGDLIESNNAQGVTAVTLAANDVLVSDGLHHWWILTQN